ncbi:MAG: DUF268 domain-containing protein [Synergistaceae bacterium]|jgi:hypothetical protein|nr:DUF268 domain-containing protein [Synergistaceae bacterium]
MLIHINFLLKSMFSAKWYYRILNVYRFCYEKYIAIVALMRKLIYRPLGPKPLKQIPEELLDNFTMQKRIPIMKLYLDDRASTSCRNTVEKYEKVFSQLQSRVFEYYGKAIFSFYDALDDYDLTEKTVIIFGLAGCNCEAMALWKGAKHVYVVDYNRPICEHERITVLNYAELQEREIIADIGFSFSSFEHDGLGRYGDSISPDGDLNAMRRAKKLIRINGLMFLGVPVGLDCVVWNAHRIYGQYRLPFLLDGWLCLDAYSWEGEDLFEAPLGAYDQPLLVLKNLPDDVVHQRVSFIKRMQYADIVAKHSKITTKDGKILKKILEMQLKHLRTNCS